MSKVIQQLSYKGYSKFPHYIWLLLRDGKLSSSSFGWFITLLGLASFDIRRPEVFGCINKDFEFLARDLGVDKSTLSKVMKKLRGLGLLEFREVHGRKLICVSHYWQYQTKIIQKLVKLSFESYSELEMLIAFVESDSNTAGTPESIEEIQLIIDNYLELNEKTQRKQLQKHGYSFINPLRRNLSSPRSKYISSINSNYINEDIDIPDADSKTDKANMYEGYDY